MISCIYFQRWTEKTCYVFLGSFLPEEMQLFSSRVKGRDAPKFHPRCPACRSNAVWVLTSRLLAAYRSLLGLASPKDGISWDWVEAKIFKNCKKKTGLLGTEKSQMLVQGLGSLISLSSYVSTCEQ